MTWEERRPSRLKVAGIYLRRGLNSIGNSSPYLSGDVFADSSDFAFGSSGLRKRPYSLRTIREADVIYCRGDLLEFFLESYYNEINAKVIIAGNSDREFYSLPERIPKSIRHFFLQNSFLQNGSFTTSIPIGIENKRWAVNGQTKFMVNSVPWNLRLNSVMIGPFGLTHETRFLIRDLFSEFEDGGIEFFPNRLDPKRYAEVSSMYKFVAAVRGNGIDTHRHWESIYRGSKVLVQLDDWSKNFMNLNLPFVYLDNWSAAEVTKAILEGSEPKNPKSVAELWWPYWKNRINQFV